MTDATGRLFDVESEVGIENGKRCATCERILDEERDFHSVLRAGGLMKRPDCRECHNRHKRIRNKYRQSPAFAATLRKQNYLCACCRTNELDGGPKTHVDHDHKTDRVLGLLCEGCNMGGGKLGDDPKSGWNWFMYQCRVKGIDPAMFIQQAS